MIKPGWRCPSCRKWVEGTMGKACSCCKRRHAFPRNWHEPSEEVFLSWNEVTQLEYCVARDKAAFKEATIAADKDFFANRIQGYLDDILALAHEGAPYAG